MLIFFIDTPVLYNVKNVHLYRMEIVQYRYEPLQIPHIFFFFLFFYNFGIYRTYDYVDGVFIIDEMQR